MHHKKNYVRNNFNMSKIVIDRVRVRPLNTWEMDDSIAIAYREKCTISFAYFIMHI